ncbi:MAG: ankyrin repeat domain-containing protein [Akkermansia sp.]|nr:ankyrin repeat domain-containing protein [Akkermansia sp.]
MVKHKIEVILIISNPYNIASRPEIKKALLNNKIPFPVVLATDIGPKPLPGDSLRPTEYTHYANHQQITTYYYEYDKNMCIVNASGKTMPTSDWKSLISKKRFPQNKKQQPALIQKKTKTRTAITPISKIEAIKKLKKEGITEDQYAQKAKDAACADNQEQLSTLIAAGADLYEAFYSSLYNKSTNCQELIIKSPSFDINKTNNQGLTPLGNFCTHTSGGYMPYFLLSVTDPIALKRLLSTPGIDINKADSQGKTPLHHLCHARNSGCLECARILLDEPNINVNARDESGKTPLWHATNENNSPLIRFITDAGGTM